MNKILNENLEEKNKQIEGLKKLYFETKDSNKQYFKNIIELERKKNNLEFLSVFEFMIIIVLISLVIIL